MSTMEKEIANEKKHPQKHSFEDLLLIKGTFTPQEAKEVLMNLISSKISFHRKKNLRSFEHYGKEDNASKQRIAELRKMRKKLKTVLNNANEDGKTIKMKSQINIEMQKSQS